MANTLVLWQGGKPVTWDITVVMYIRLSGLTAMSRDILLLLTAASRKEAKFLRVPFCANRG